MFKKYRQPSAATLIHQLEKKKKKEQKKAREAATPPRGRLRQIWYNDVYLKSEHWRTMVLRHKKELCQMCGYDKWLSLHHRTYKNLGDEAPGDFITLCDYCHKASHIQLKSSKKLKNPSHGLAQLAYKIQHNSKQKPESWAQYLRRRYIAKHGDKGIPEIRVFRLFYSSHIKGYSFPFKGAIHNRLDTFVENMKNSGKLVKQGKQSKIYAPWETPKGTKPPTLKKTTFVQNLSLVEWKATRASRFRRPTSNPEVVAKRVQRKLQRSVAGRMLEPEMVPQRGAGTGRDRKLATSLQSG